MDGPCWVCGKTVDLSSPITVNVINGDKTTTTEMAEANARALLAQLGMGAPSVLCGEHDEIALVLP